MTPAQQAHLEAIRSRLDALDDELLAVLEARGRLVQSLWEWKDREGLPRTDAAREHAVVERLVARGAERGLDPEVLRPVLLALVGRHLSPARGSGS